MARRWSFRSLLNARCSVSPSLAASALTSKHQALTHTLAFRWGKARGWSPPKWPTSRLRAPRTKTLAKEARLTEPGGVCTSAVTILQCPLSAATPTTPTWGGVPRTKVGGTGQAGHQQSRPNRDVLPGYPGPVSPPILLGPGLVTETHASRDASLIESRLCHLTPPPCALPPQEQSVQWCEAVGQAQAAREAEAANQDALAASPYFLRDADWAFLHHQTKGTAYFAQGLVLPPISREVMGPPGGPVHTTRTASTPGPPLALTAPTPAPPRAASA
ncbi:hypothetical protein T484DRAFT_3474159 [Baffinella frigidus]|nr:hypothetical protein T484DRAFT_3474159 [Cryptophyta sp. CCMP2293]